MRSLSLSLTLSWERWFMRPSHEIVFLPNWSKFYDALTLYGYNNLDSSSTIPKHILKP